MRRLVVSLVETEEPIGAELGSAWVADCADAETVAACLDHVASQIRALGVTGTAAATAHGRRTHREARG